MKTTQKTKITVKCEVDVSVSDAWEYWTIPAHITQWKRFSDDWMTPKAENNLCNGGKFNFHMHAKDGSGITYFKGDYLQVVKYKLITYTTSDGAICKVHFNGKDGKTEIIERIEIKHGLSETELIKRWQFPLDNFKAFTDRIK